MTVDVLRLPVEEWEAYRALRLRALAEDPEGFCASYADAQAQPDEFWRRRLADALQGDRSWLLFAREQGKLVGMIGAYLEDNSADIATIVSVYVPKEERGKGISAQLMEEMLQVLTETRAFKKAQLMVNVSQMPAIKLYKRFGFHEVGRQPSTTGAGVPIQQIVMERQLGPLSRKRR